jgi:hypothetical protein
LYRSDSLAICKAFEEWEKIKGYKEKMIYCSNNFLSGFTMNTMADFRKQLYDILIDLGYLNKETNFNENSNNPKLVRAALIVCFY